VIERFSKPLGAVQWYQSDAVDNETNLLNRQVRVETALAHSQPSAECLICGSPQTWEAGFDRNGIRFGLCTNCSHVNVNRTPSESFLQQIYGSDESPVYADEFTDGKMESEYWRVVDEIYLPKAEFLAQVLASEGLVDPLILDVGCGSGHFLNALLKAGFSNVRGVETLPKAVEAAHKMGLSGRVEVVTHEQSERLLRETDAQVITMMCVLPHLPQPTEALRSMAANPATQYTFQKLPMWSLATLIEAATPHRRARVLGQDHTNVFTRESLAWLENAVPMECVGQWWFGQDILDLLRRSMLAGTPEFAEQVSAQIAPALDNLQQAIDRERLSSELHAVWKFSTQP